jgi:nickel-dependent lactate racemase
VSQYQVAWGTGLTPPFTLPKSWQVTEIAAPRPVRTASPEELVAAAMRQPHGESLSTLARGAQRVVIAVTDMTRPCPDHLLVPVLLRELQAAGVGQSSILILVATGLHRPMTEGEIRSRLGPKVPATIAVANHDARDPEGLVEQPPLDDGLPVFLSRKVMEADLVLATGMVEPHLYAGFSGGPKVVSIGCAGEPTIAATHSPRYLDQPGTRLGVLRGNPFARAVRDLGRRSRLRFVLEVVLDAEDQVVAAAAGEPEAVLDQLGYTCGQLALHPVEDTYDLVVAGVPHPKDVNVYQASRVPTYLQLGARPLVRQGGAIVVAGRCPEGLGAGAGESRFACALQGMTDPAEYVRARANARFSGGDQRAYVMAKVLAGAQVVLAGVEHPERIQAGLIAVAPTVPEAIALAGIPADRPARVLVVPDPFRRLPVPKECEK